jgi:hypothetical protein
MTYLTDIAFHRDNPIYARDLTNWKRDSKHAAEQRKAYRLRLIRASSRFLLSRILNRMTLPNSSVSVLVAAGALFASHYIYV